MTLLNAIRRGKTRRRLIHLRFLVRKTPQMTHQFQTKDALWTLDTSTKTLIVTAEVNGKPYSRHWIFVEKSFGYDFALDLWLKSNEYLVQRLTQGDPDFEAWLVSTGLPAFKTALWSTLIKEPWLHSLKKIEDFLQESNASIQALETP